MPPKKTAKASGKTKTAAKATPVKKTTTGNSKAKAAAAIKAKPNAARTKASSKANRPKSGLLSKIATSLASAREKRASDKAKAAAVKTAPRQNRAAAKVPARRTKAATLVQSNAEIRKECIKIDRKLLDRKLERMSGLQASSGIMLAAITLAFFQDFFQLRELYALHGATPIILMIGALASCLVSFIGGSGMYSAISSKGLSTLESEDEFYEVYSGNLNFCIRDSERHVSNMKNFLILSMVLMACFAMYVAFYAAQPIL